jgi:colanic acid/amylovoran biosynthesis protein
VSADDVVARTLHVLVVNQHGDNTGDEAALRAMLDGMAARLGPVRFTVLHQFREPSSCVDVAHDVTWLSLVLPPAESAALALHLLVGPDAAIGRRWLGSRAAEVVAAYDTADLVVSAPGGPYFGDVYRRHEPVHWAYVWLARRHRRPIGLYATSAGPFRTRVFNPFRRATYRCFDRLVLREDVSAQHVRELMRGKVALEVTADSALQERVPPQQVQHWSTADVPADAVVVAVSAIDAAYAGDSDPSARRDNYDRSIVAALAALAACTDRPVHVVFVPQLQSEAHDDAPYLRRLASALPAEVGREVVGGRRSSVEQRGIFARAELVIAGRYHPAVFAVSAEVPVLTVPYEHKAAGLMDAAGLSEFCIPLDEVSPGRLSAVAADLWHRREEVRGRLAHSEPELRRRAARTTELMAELVDPSGERRRAPVEGQDPANDA